MRVDAGVVHFEEAGVGHFGDERDLFAGLDLIGRGRQLDLIRNAVDQPAHQLPPVRLVRHVLDRNLGVHLPGPRVVHREGERLAAAVTLIRERDRLAAALVDPAQKRGGARLDLADGIHADDRAAARPTASPIPARSFRSGSPRAIARRVSASPGCATSFPAASIPARPEAHRLPECRHSRLRQTIGGRRSSSGRRRGDRRSRQSCAADRR